MKIKYINLVLIEFFLPACWCLMFSVRSCRCRGMKPIRDWRNWRKVRIIYSFPLWWRRIWHASQNRYQHWEPYGLHNISGVWTKIRNEVVHGWGQLNSNVPLGLSDEATSFISSLQSSPQRNECPGDAVPDWALLQGECWGAGCPSMSAFCFFVLLFFITVMFPFFLSLPIPLPTLSCHLLHFILFPFIALFHPLSSPVPSLPSHANRRTYGIAHWT